MHGPVMTTEIHVTDRRFYRFGPYVLDAPKRLLWRDSALVPITSKTFEILLFLIQRRGRVVEKQELLEAVWPKTAVEENTLTRHVSTLRKALEERPDHHEYILTVPGHGYQFVADVIELDRRPDNLLHTLRTEPSAENGDHSAGESLHGVWNGEITPIPASVPLRVASDDARPARSLHGVGLAVVLGLTVVTTALVVAALRVDTPNAPSAARNLRQVTFLGGVQTDPTWAPDGRRLAYASEHGGNSDIFVQALGEPTPRQLTSSSAEDSQPDWSPDGAWIVFRSEAGSGGLFVVPTAGGATRKIASFGFHPRWSPSGGTILFSSSGHLGGTPKFYLVGLDGAPPAALRPDILDEVQRLHVAWRPDGQSVSFWVRHADGRRSLLTTPIRGGAAVESTIDPAVERRRQNAGLTLERFVWAPSGQHLYFEGSAQGTGSLWRITVDPQTLGWIDGPDRLTTGTTRDTDAALSPDGKRVVFSARSSKTRLWMFPFDAVAGKILVPVSRSPPAQRESWMPTRPTTGPSWSTARFAAPGSRCGSGRSPTAANGCSWKAMSG